MFSGLTNAGVDRRQPTQTGCRYVQMGRSKPVSRRCSRGDDGLASRSFWSGPVFHRKELTHTTPGMLWRSSPNPVAVKLAGLGFGYDTA